MFWAIDKTTGVRVNSIAVEFSVDFMKTENWYADPIEIEYCPPNVNIHTIPIIYRKESKDIINNKGTIFNKAPHFYIPNANELGITSKPEQKEHTQAKNLIFNLLKENKIVFNISTDIKNNITNTIEFTTDDFNLNDINIEVVIKNKYSRRADILLPFKNKHPLLGFGIDFEIQLTPETERKEIERSFERANLGYSVSWVKPNEFDEDMKLKNNMLNVEPYGSKIVQYIKLTENTWKDATINFSKMLDEKMNMFNILINKLNYPIILCKKCNNVMVLKKGKYGLFCGCSNYPNCKNIIKVEEQQ